jgi:pimeloyl-ACP methyl ester carboxylesterase
MGGGVGLLMAGCFPARISRLVVIEGLGPLAAPADDVPDRLAAHIKGRRLSKRPRPYPDLAAAMSVREAQPNAPLSREAAALIVGRGTLTSDGGVCWRSDPRLQLQSPMRLTESQVQAFARRVRCPVQVIIANDGWPFPEEAVNQRLACLRSVDVLRRSGTHHLHINDPEQIAAEVGAFLVGESS